jgi:integrase
MLEHLKILYYLPVGKKTKEGKTPIYVRITLNGKRATFTTSIYIRPENWDNRERQVANMNKFASKLNSRLNVIKDKIHETYFKLESLNRKFTATDIRDFLLNREKKEEKNRSLFSLFDDHNKKIKALIPTEFALPTYVKYCTTLKHLREFVELKYKMCDFLLRDINYEFLAEFDFYLRSKKNCSNNSAVKYLKNLKKILRIALVNNWIDTDPFLKYKYKVEKVDRGFLTVEELTRLHQKVFTNIRLEQVRDVFLFQCYTGLSYCDLFKLTRENINQDDNGVLWLRTRRTKTGTPVNVPLLPIAIDILQKYKGYNEKNDKLLPVPSNQKLNKYLKELGHICGIEKILHTHLGRHSFASSVTLANGISLESVSKMLGHSNLVTTKIYARMMDSRVLDEMLLLQQKLKNQVKE